MSYLHFYLENYSIGEDILFLHADNCSGQNKNNIMMIYLMWRVLNDRHKQITISFLITGHTKFSPDGGFGLIKRKYNKTVINCLADIAEVVDTSSAMNSAVLIGLENSNVSHVPTFDWSGFLGPFFGKLKSLKSYHHFIFKKTGVICKESVNAPEEPQSFLKKDATCPRDLPPEIKSPGLTPKRQWYLHDQIREFVDDRFKDTTTPKPSVARPGPSGDQEEEEDSESEDETPRPSTSRGKSLPSKVPSKSGRGRGIKKARVD